MHAGLAQAAMAKYTAANTSPIDQAFELQHYFYLGDDRVMEPPKDPTPPEEWSPQACTGGGLRTKVGLVKFWFGKRSSHTMHIVASFGELLAPQPIKECICRQ
jgi:hypothetical protein